MATRELKRAISIERTGLDKEKRTLPIAISSECVVRGEVLSHKAEHIDLTRANDNGLPLLWNHNSDKPIGRVRDIRIDADGVLRGVAHFSSNPKALEVLADIDGDTLRDASVGAMVDLDKLEFREDVVIIRGWTPLEVSIVSVPADASVGINRGHQMQSEGKTMTEKTELSVIDAHKATERGQKLEAERRDAIDSVFDDYLNLEGVNTLRKRAITESWDAAKAAMELNKILRSALVSKQPLPEVKAEPLAADPPQSQNRSATPSAQAGDDALDKFMVAASDAIMARGRAFYTPEGKIDDAKIRQVRAENPFVGRTLLDIVREYCHVTRLDVSRDPTEVAVSKAMRNRAAGMGNADLPALVENIFNKMMMVPLAPAEENWRALVKTSSLTDFKQTSRVNIGSASNLKEIGNGGTIQRGFISDFKEYLQARTFGIELVVEYQTIRNDDVNALTGLPLEIRRKANRKVGDLVWAVFTGNPTLGQDSIALFHTSHNNIITAGAAPSITTLEVGFVAMGTQRAPSPTGNATLDPGDYLNIVPRFLVVPLALKGRADLLRTSVTDPFTAVTPGAANSWQGRLETIYDARLDAFNPAGWFMVADPQQQATIEVGFVDGQETPIVMQEDDWGTRGIKYAVWHDFDVKAMDYRGMFYNDGA